jgi:hypothetical protein
VQIKNNILNFILAAAVTLPMLIWTSGCGPGSGRNKHPTDPLEDVTPVWTSITYYNNGAQMTLSPPFSSTQVIMADPNSGSCTGNTSEVVFNGTYNQTAISNITLTGLTTTADPSANTFRFTGCMPFGASAVTITAYDTQNRPVRVVLTASLSSVLNTKTLGFGSSVYPDTGFSFVGAAPVISTLLSGITSLANFYVGPTGSQSTASTGATGYTLETGFTNYIMQSSP